ncbi:MAG: TIGR01777 family oxidoreductase [Chlamydiales bacterium]
MKIVIAGSSGFIGSHLVPFLQEKGHELILLSRTSKHKAQYWNPEAGQIDPSAIEGANVVINLCGASIVGRWNEKKMEELRESRFISSKFLCDTIMHLRNPPKLYISASAIGYYGDRGDKVLTETSLSGHGYLAEICRRWESIPEKLTKKSVRVVLARFGPVLGEGGGILKRMKKPFQMGFGAVLGSGKQMMSWIALDDVLEGIIYLIDHPEISGPVNFVSPHAVTNYEFTKTMAHLLNRPVFITVPRFALSFLFGSGGSEVFLSSTHVQPERLLKSGFHFAYSNIEPALKKYLQINT